MFDVVFFVLLMLSLLWLIFVVYVLAGVGARALKSTPMPADVSATRKLINSVTKKLSASVCEKGENISPPFCLLSSPFSPLFFLLPHTHITHTSTETNKEVVNNSEYKHWYRIHWYSWDRQREPVCFDTVGLGGSFSIENITIVWNYKKKNISEMSCEISFVSVVISPALTLPLMLPLTPTQTHTHTYIWQRRWKKWQWKAASLARTAQHACQIFLQTYVSVIVREWEREGGGESR